MHQRNSQGPLRQERHCYRYDVQGLLEQAAVTMSPAAWLDLPTHDWRKPKSFNHSSLYVQAHDMHQRRTASLPSAVVFTES